MNIAADNATIIMANANNSSRTMTTASKSNQVSKDSPIPKAKERIPFGMIQSNVDIAADCTTTIKANAANATTAAASNSSASMTLSNSGGVGAASLGSKSNTIQPPIPIHSGRVKRPNRTVVNYTGMCEDDNHGDGSENVKRRVKKKVAELNKARSQEALTKVSRPALSIIL
mmetsp:Transcript_26698/g.34219  ORF Transcript_26698/g.34219 Transcript_26698/m.34219 type:complete len:172 (+) Transcript_26698:2-517(+)